jgi:hypothetical protein
MHGMLTKRGTTFFVSPSWLKRHFKVEGGIVTQLGDKVKINLNQIFI